MPTFGTYSGGDRRRRRDARAARALLRPDAGHRAALLGQRPTTPRTPTSAPPRSCSRADPSRRDDDMCRWLRTTVKHEALAIRRQRERDGPAGRARPGARAGRRPARHRRARGALRAAAPRRAGAAAGSSRRRSAAWCCSAEGYTYKEICAADRLLLHEGQPLPQGGPRARSRPGWPGSSRATSAGGSHRCCPRWPTARRAPRTWPPSGPTCAPACPAGRGCASTARCPRGWRRWCRRSRSRAAAAARGRCARSRSPCRRRAGPRGRAGRPRPPGGRAGGRPEGGGGGGLGGGAGRWGRGARRAPGRERREGAFACGANGAAEARRRAGAARRHAHAAARTHPGVSARAGSRSRPAAPAPRPEPANEFAPDAAASSAAPRRPPAGGEFAPGGGSSGGGEFGP